MSLKQSVILPRIHQKLGCSMDLASLILARDVLILYLRHKRYTIN